tara:strand:- start:595 stop:1077 length:483 start_codon:yes stop_codon:yes gene_type:complete
LSFAIKIKYYVGNNFFDRERIMEKKNGGCLCGETRYQLEGAAVAEIICHCADCKKQTGSSYSVIAGFTQDQFKWIADKQIKHFETGGDSGGSVKRFFCGECGSPLLSDASATPGLYWIKTGSLDDSSWVKPSMEIYAKDKIQSGNTTLELQSYQNGPPRN